MFKDLKPTEEGKKDDDSGGGPFGALFAELEADKAKDESAKKEGKETKDDGAEEGEAASAIGGKQDDHKDEKNNESADLLTREENEPAAVKKQ